MGIQQKLHTKLVQKLILTPSLQQAIKLLPMSTLELSDLLNQEMVENPMLEELEETATSLDERTGIEGDRERSAEEVATEAKREEKDPFDEIDFGSYFQDYLDPGFRTASNFEVNTVTSAETS